MYVCGVGAATTVGSGESLAATSDASGVGEALLPGPLTTDPEEPGQHEQDQRREDQRGRERHEPSARPAGRPAS